MGMSIDDIKHCLKVMVDCEVCEECNLYGTTGTDHCEYDCVCGALDIISKYQMFQAEYVERLKADMVAMLEELQEELREMHEDFFETEHFDEAYGVSNSMDIIQQKINALKGESND